MEFFKLKKKKCTITLENVGISSLHDTTSRIRRAEVTATAQQETKTSRFGRFSRL
jgi:hypothetical protein